MINLRLRTEYNFGRAYGPVQKVVQKIKSLNQTAAAITDIGTWGHVAFANECRSAGIKPILGCEIAVVEDSKLREKQPQNYMALLARNNEGLKEIYENVTLSTSKDNFYYIPRIDYGDISAITDNVIVLSGTNPRLDLLQPKRNLFVELSYLSSGEMLDWGSDNKLQQVLTGNNFYPAAEDKAIYEILLHKDRDNCTFPMHIADENELRFHTRESALMFTLAVQATKEIADECNVDLPQAQLVRFKSDQTLEQLCRAAIPTRCSSWNENYEQRLMRELQLIKEKDYEDYFYVLWDALKYAKQHMLVGPARGSSCGSLVCYLLSITEIDPLPYGLLFERFIDVTRKDLPDVDIDFADDRRELVFSYLEQKYGIECVVRLGTISRYKAKSAISCVAKSTLVPESEVAELKSRIIERSTGDSRARFCIMDTFNELDIGRAVLDKYPHMRYAGDLEYHASHSGQHAAGIVVTQHPITDYCSVDNRTGAAQVDKYDAEKLNLLKIDALGLRTLSILQDILDQIGMSRDELYKLPTDDQKAFDILNSKRYAGIFQFEGFALQGLCQKIKIKDFNDYCVITALARPGPLDSGSTKDYINRCLNPADYGSYHDIYDEITKDTKGVIVYQEQIMQLVRQIGDFTWEEVSDVRKAIGKSLGSEYLNKYRTKFIDKAMDKGIKLPGHKQPEIRAESLWDHICTHGRYSFNKSHAVAYGLVSYWCCYLKAHYPLEFALANLRNSKDDPQTVKMLREFSREGYSYLPYDAAKSEINWSLQDGVLVGGLTAIKGCGVKKAEAIIKKRKNKETLGPGEVRLLNTAQTPWDDIFECKTKWGYIKSNPAAYNIVSPIYDIGDITDETEGDFIVFGKIKEKILKDANDPVYLSKRGGQKSTSNNLWLNIIVEDDTGSIMARISRYQYEEFGKPIMEGMTEDVDWLLIKGNISKGFRLINIDRYRHLTKKGDK